MRFGVGHDRFAFVARTFIMPRIETNMFFFKGNKSNKK
jgi:hypothetical protein